MTLKTYRKKRNFKLTQEPKGRLQAQTRLSEKTKNIKPNRVTSKLTKSNPKRVFVVHKHAARHLHYDLRLEMEGVLKSWAVPKGPSLNPKIKRLAVGVEDHPLEYATFEGIIPKHQYGAGTVEIWDSGTWVCRPMTNPLKAYQKGDVTFELKGKKLKGLWKLIKMKGSFGDERTGKRRQNNWLLFKIEDKFAKLNNRMKADALKKKSNFENKNITKDIVKQQSFKNNIELNLKGTEKKSLPKNFSPQLAYSVDKIPEGNNWLHEIKFDGYRIIAIIDQGKVKLISRNGKDWSKKFPIQCKQLSAFPCKRAILDGEMVVLDNKGISRFELLQNSFNNDSNQVSHKIDYFVFDLLFLDQFDLTKVPLIERKAKLLELFKKWQIKQRQKPSNIFYSDHIQGHGKEILKKACQSRLEGIISKESQSPYYHIRSRNWLKSKCIQRQEFVIGGFTKPHGSRQYFGALLIGLLDKHNRFIYCGKVGTGFDSESLQQLFKKMQPLHQSSSAFYNFAKGSLNSKSKHIKKEVTWLAPKLVCELEFLTWTKDGLLRHPSFLGLRQDKDAQTVMQEHTVKKPQKKSSQKQVFQKKAGQKETIDSIVLTHPDKILGPTGTITKAELAHYYSSIAEKILPHIVNRPLLIMRCYSLQKTKSATATFFQKHYNKAFPKSIYPVQTAINTINADNANTKDNSPYLMIKDKQGLLALVQFDVIEIHPWGSQAQALEQPDRIIFDLDPSEEVKWSQVIQAALYINKELKTIGLKSYVKTTGGKGLHIMIPIIPDLDWSEIKSFTKDFAEFMVQKYPQLFVATQTKSKRTNKIFIDYLRNGRGATSVAIYSTRAKKSAPISFPVSWRQLTKIQAADQFNLKNYKSFINGKLDPWNDFFSCKQKITKGMKHHWSKK